MEWKRKLSKAVPESLNPVALVKKSLIQRTQLLNTYYWDSMCVLSVEVECK